MKRKYILMTVIALMASAAMANVANMTYQQWNFDIPWTIYGTTIQCAPDIDENPYGQPVANLKITQGHSYFSSTQVDPAGWYTSHAGKDGVIYGENVGMQLWIPNIPNDEATKDIWVEVGFTGHFLVEGQGDPYFDSTKNYVDTAGDVQLVGYSITDYGGQPLTQSNSADWKKLCVHWTVTPQPLDEIVNLYFYNSGVNIDYVACTTTCPTIEPPVPPPSQIPAPGAVILASLGVTIVSFIKRRNLF